MIRIGVLTDGPTIAGWQAVCLAEIVEVGVAEVAAVIVNAGALDAAPAEAARRRDLSKSTWNLLNRVESRLANRRDVNGWNADFDVDDEIDIAARHPEAEILHVHPLESPSGFVHRLTDDDIETVRALDLDILLRFGFGILRGPVLDVAREGIWSFHHGDNDVNRGAVPGVYEIVDGEAYTGTILQRLGPELDNGVVLRKARYVTVSRSWNLNRRQAYAKSHRLLVDALRELDRTGKVEPIPDDDRPFGLYRHPMYRKPTTVNAVRAAVGVVTASLRHKIRFATSAQVWSLLVCRGPLENASMFRMQEIAAPVGRFWADPFVVENDGEHHVFFEDFDFATGRGRVSTGRLVDDGLADVTPVLAPDYHLSYPCVFDLDGVLHMIPESSENRTIEMWRCDEFPARWSRVGALLDDVSAVDTTPLFHDGLWYVFCNIDRSGGDGYADELHLFTSPDLSPGSLTPHPASPVVTDAEYARMGGNFRTQGDRLLRPAQRGGEFYGSGLAFMEVEKLSPTEYRESVAETILPTWDPDITSIHHCATDGAVTVFDIARWQPKRTTEP